MLLLITSVHLHVQTNRWHHHRWALIGIPKRIWLITVLLWSFHHMKRPNRQMKQIMKIPQMDDSTAFFSWGRNKRDSLSAKEQNSWSNTLTQRHNWQILLSTKSHPGIKQDWIQLLTPILVVETEPDYKLCPACPSCQTNTWSLITYRSKCSNLG